FLWWAQTFEGRSAEAAKTANTIIKYAQEKTCGTIPVLEAPRFRHLPWLTAARFGKWDSILSVPEPSKTPEFIVDRVAWHFTRGGPFAAKENEERAAQEHAALKQLGGGEVLKKRDTPLFPASATMAIPDHLLAGKVAEARGDWTTAVGEFEKA